MYRMQLQRRTCHHVQSLTQSITSSTHPSINRTINRSFVAITGGVSKRARSNPLQANKPSVKHKQPVNQPEASPLEFFQSSMTAAERSLYDSLYASHSQSQSADQSVQPFAPPTRIQNVSELYLPITRETPSVSHAMSHHLLLKGGFVRSTTSGIYSYLPLGLKVISRLTDLIDTEMRTIGASKADLPLLLSAALWQKTGRWSSTGSELFRLKDRKGADFLLGPTHEEAITDLVATDVHTYRQLPVRLYQIGKKFRDEARPRAGVLRAREFLMKDLYTFDVSEARALESYDEVVAAYKRIFERLGVRYIQAEADTGNIGGDNSHEFHIPSEAGEDQILKCSKCSYAANLEKAVGELPLESSTQSTDNTTITSPSKQSSKQLTKPVTPSHTNLTDDNMITRFVRSLIPKQGLRDVPMKYEVLVNPDNKSSVYILLIAANREVNPLLVKSHLGCGQCFKVSASEALRLIGECIKHQSNKSDNPSMKAEILVDTSVVQHGVDIDVETMSELLQSVEMEESQLSINQSKEKLAADAESELSEFDLDLPESELMRPDGEVDLAKLMNHIDSIMQTDKGQSLMNKFSANKDPSGNVRFGAKASIESQLPTLDQIKAKVNPVSKPTVDESIKQSIIDAPRQGVFRSAAAGDRCMCRGCTGTLTMHKGIEVGHVFYLGTKYSAPLNAQFKSSTGQLKPIEMGCYGLGVSRLLAAMVEVNNDERGIIWPSSIAPFAAVVVPIDEQSVETAQEIYRTLSQSSNFRQDILFDDRVGEDGMRLGARMRHLQCTGIPHFILVGKSSIVGSSDVQPTVEIETRRDGSKVIVPVNEMVDTLTRLKGEEIKEGIKRARS